MDLRLPYCRLDDEGFIALCDGLSGNSTLKRLHLDGNDQITSLDGELFQLFYNIQIAN